MSGEEEILGVFRLPAPKVMSLLVRFRTFLSDLSLCVETSFQCGSLVATDSPSWLSLSLSSMVLKL